MFTRMSYVYMTVNQCFSSKNYVVQTALCMFFLMQKKKNCFAANTHEQELLFLSYFISYPWFAASLQGQTKVKRTGQCCEECVTAKGSCLHEGMVRYHGDIWNGTGCEFCTCTRGQVLCQRAECGQVECPQVSSHYMRLVCVL